MIRRVTMLFVCIIAMFIIMLAVIFRISGGREGYDFIITNRIEKTSVFGVHVKEKFEIWVIGKTVHGGTCEKPLFADGKFWN